MAVQISLVFRFLEICLPIICWQGIHRKRWTEQLSLGCGEVMELKLIKHDETLEDLAGQLKEF